MSNAKSLLSFLEIDMGFKGKFCSVIDRPQILKFVIQWRGIEDMRSKLKNETQNLRTMQREDVYLCVIPETN